MKTTVIITKRGAGYIATVADQHHTIHNGTRCGLTPYEAAASAARYMIHHAMPNPEGGTLMAPPEVMELVPAHLREIAPNSGTISVS